jgi:hypothetical protein
MRSQPHDLGGNGSIPDSGTSVVGASVSVFPAQISFRLSSAPRDCGSIPVYRFYFETVMD